MLLRIRLHDSATDTSRWQQLCPGLQKRSAERMMAQHRAIHSTINTALVYKHARRNLKQSLRFRRSQSCPRHSQILPKNVLLVVVRQALVTDAACRPRRGCCTLLGRCYSIEKELRLDETELELLPNWKRRICQKLRAVDSKLSWARR